MKKALQISIAQTLFTAEEDAYAALEKYLASVKKHFDTTEGRDEIIADIESRIAEQLLEKKEAVITLATVEQVLARMGRVEDFEDEQAENSSTNTPTDSPPLKKLYRNPDDMVIAGVCSGIAAYFGIEVLWVRLAAFALALMNGFGILLYIVLWISMPLAKTGAQKLEMSGSPVTLETLSEAMNERVEELKGRDHSRLRRIISLPFRIIGKIIRTLVGSVGPLLRILIGVLLVVASLPALIGISIAGGFLMSGDVWVTNEIALQTLLSDSLHWLIVGAVMCAVFIPILFVLFAGISLLRKKSVIPAFVGLGLLGVWFVALLVSGFGAATILTRYQEAIDVSPAYQQTTTSLPLTEDFDALSVTVGTVVHIKTGVEVNLEATGRAKDMDTVQARVEDGTLIIERSRKQSSGRICIFCFSSQPELTLTVPSLSQISAERGTIIRSDNFPKTSSLILVLKNGSQANLALDVSSLTADIAHGAILKLEGVATSVDISSGNGSLVDTESLETTTAKIVAGHGSIVRLGTLNSLTVEADYGSIVTYRGNPELTQKAEHGSIIESKDSE